MAPLPVCPLRHGQVTHQVFPEATVRTQSLKVSVTPSWGSPADLRLWTEGTQIFAILIPCSLLSHPPHTLTPLLRSLRPKLQSLPPKVYRLESQNPAPDGS